MVKLVFINIWKSTCFKYSQKCLQAQDLKTCKKYFNNQCHTKHVHKTFSKSLYSPRLTFSKAYRTETLSFHHIAPLQLCELKNRIYFFLTSTINTTDFYQIHTISHNIHTHIYYHLGIQIINQTLFLTTPNYTCCALQLIL